MEKRSLIAFAVLIAVQALAGCQMPAKSGVVRHDRTVERNAEFDARKPILRRQVEAGTFGLAQLYPAGLPVDPRNLRPLPRTFAVTAVTSLGVTRPVPSETPVAAATRLQVAFASGAGYSGGCVYKPIMSDTDIEACR